jgi:hypothetical protein
LLVAGSVAHSSQETKTKLVRGPGTDHCIGPGRRNHSPRPRGRRRSRPACCYSCSNRDRTRSSPGPSQRPNSHRSSGSRDRSRSPLRRRQLSSGDRGGWFPRSQQVRSRPTSAPLGTLVASEITSPASAKHRPSYLPYRHDPGGGRLAYARPAWSAERRCEPGPVVRSGRKSTHRPGPSARFPYPRCPIDCGGSSAC